MNKLRNAFTLMAFLCVLTGCQSLGTTQPKSFADREAYAVGIYTAVQNTVAISIGNGSMSSTEGSVIIKQGETAKVILDTARAAFNAGDTAGADAKLATALTVLQALQAYLNTQGAKT